MNMVYSLGLRIGGKRREPGASAEMVSFHRAIGPGYGCFWLQL
jgi:hypothetical protein